MEIINTKFAEGLCEKDIFKIEKIFEKTSIKDFKALTDNLGLSVWDNRLAENKSLTLIAKISQKLIIADANWVREVRGPDFSLRTGETNILIDLSPDRTEVILTISVASITERLNLLYSSEMVSEKTIRCSEEKPKNKLF